MAPPSTIPAPNPTAVTSTTSPALAPHNSNDSAPPLHSPAMDSPATRPAAPNNQLDVEESVLNTLIHGNYVNDAVQWDPGISDHTIPDSYYLAGRPP